MEETLKTLDAIETDASIQTLIKIPSGVMQEIISHIEFPEKIINFIRLMETSSSVFNIVRKTLQYRIH